MTTNPEVTPPAATVIDVTLPSATCAVRDSAAGCPLRGTR